MRKPDTRTHLEFSDRLILGLLRISHMLHVAGLLWADSPWLQVGVFGLVALGDLIRANPLLALCLLIALTLLVGLLLLYLLLRKLDRMHAEFRRLRSRRRERPTSPSPKASSGTISKREKLGSGGKQVKPARPTKRARTKR